jgi:hypothetical protein
MSMMGSSSENFVNQGTGNRIAPANHGPFGNKFALLGLFSDHMQEAKLF